MCFELDDNDIDEEWIELETPIEWIFIYEVNYKEEMVRKGFYAVYAGQEYHWVEEGDAKKQGIYTHDVSKTDGSFVPCRDAISRDKVQNKRVINNYHLRKQEKRGTGDGLVRRGYE